MKLLSHLLMSGIFLFTSIAYASDRYQYEVGFVYENTEFSAIGSVDFDSTALGIEASLSPVEYDGNPYRVLPFLQKTSSIAFAVIDEEISDADGFALNGRYVHEKIKFPVIFEAFIRSLEDSEPFGQSTDFLETEFGIGVYFLPGTAATVNLILGKADTSSIDRSLEGFSIEMNNVTKMANGKSFAFDASLTDIVVSESGSPDVDRTAIEAGFDYYVNPSTSIGVSFELVDVSSGFLSDDLTLLGFSVEKFFTKNIAAEFSYEFGDTDSGVDVNVITFVFSGRFGG